MFYINFLAFRFFLKARGGFLSFMSFVSILGIVVGVSVLIVVMAVMNGFDNELQSKIIQNNPHILITAQDVMSANRSWLNKFKVDQVVSVVPMAYSQVFIRVRNKILPILLRGVPREDFSITCPRKVYGSWPKSGELLVGKQLAKQFNLWVGDELVIISPITGEEFHFRISGIFSSGMYDYDLNLAYASLSDVQHLLFIDTKINALAIYLKNPFEANYVKKHLYNVIATNKLSALTWIEANKSLFSALKLEKYVMFLILLLIVVVASFNVVSSLVVLVATRTKEIAILKTLGLLDREIYMIFMGISLMIGAIGSFVGVGLGVAISWCIEKWHIIHLPPQVYYIPYLPAKLSYGDVFMVGVSAFVIALVSGLYPAMRAAKLIPSSALRYE